MARPASVFVRGLSVEEAQRLRRISRQSKVFALRQRAQIVLASDSGSSAPEIARVLQTDENQVRRVIGEFNADGMESLRPRIGGGCPRRIDDAAHERIRAIALARPDDFDEPGTRWSLATLRRYLLRAGVVGAISKEHLRRDLAVDGDYGAAHPHVEVEQRPVVRRQQGPGPGRLPGCRGGNDQRGRGLFRRVRPDLAETAPGQRLVPQRPSRPAAGDVSPSPRGRKLLGAYDVGADVLWGRVEDRRVTGEVVLEFLQDIRRATRPT